ncbi:MAG TPA: GNAT family N-acetyltransferase [Chthonomonadaceae bacterium]|nr:GNAT family N-acetyltransferase [Chthonomonadaceae bacterium]
MTFVLRPLDFERDLPRLARLTSLTESEPVTEEILRDRERKSDPNGVCQRIVACSPTGEIVGYGSLLRRAYEAPGRFRIGIAVDPAWRGRGAGAALYDALNDLAGKQEARSLFAWVREGDAAGLRFAGRRGFAVDRHIFESALDVAAFDPAPFAGILAKVEAMGIHFFTFADTDGSEAAQRKLYELNTLTGMDIPGDEKEIPRPFEQFARDVFGGYWFRPDGQIFAADGERWVGMAAVGETHPGIMVNMHTGVLREYRGRHIALALKLLALDFCRRRNAHTIRTNNDSQNVPMRRINARLGYLPEPGWFRVETQRESRH